MTTRNLDPELVAIFDAIEGGRMFDDGVTFEQMRERFELTAPMMWDASNLPVHAVEDRTIEGDGPALPVRIYTPLVSDAPLPVLVYFHGGGFTIGSIETADPISRFLAREAGCIVVNVGFRSIRSPSPSTTAGARSGGPRPKPRRSAATLLGSRLAVTHRVGRTRPCARCARTTPVSPRCGSSSCSAPAPSSPIATRRVMSSPTTG